LAKKKPTEVGLNARRETWRFVEPRHSAFGAANTRYRRGSIQPASAGVGGSDRTWTMKQELKTPNYTTCWKNLPRARA